MIDRQYNAHKIAKFKWTLALHKWKFTKIFENRLCGHSLSKWQNILRLFKWFFLFYFLFFCHPFFFSLLLLSLFSILLSLHFKKHPFPPPLFLTSWLIGVSRSASCCPSPFSWVVSPYLPMREAYSVTELQAHALHTSRYSAHSCWAYPAFFSPGERIARIHREARLRAKTTDAPLPCSWEVKSMDCEHVVQ